MKTMRWLSAAAFVAACLFTQPAAAQQSVADVLSEWGMVGTWSTDCAKQPAENHFHYHVVVNASGAASYDRDRGAANLNDSNPITAAALRADGTLELTVNFPGLNQSRVVVYAKEPNRIRAMYNRGSGGDVSVENGVFKHNGQPTPWQFRCK